jgi:alpha-tubulin suppressor-like RCC1 family protein
VAANTGNLALSPLVLVGWNTKADGTGASYAMGSSLRVGAADVKLFAVWRQTASFLVTYDANGATGGSVPRDEGFHAAGATVPVLWNPGALAKSGSFFAGWNTAADGSGTSYTEGQSLTMGAAPITLYAKWTSTAFSLTYLPNGADSGAAPTDGARYVSQERATASGNTGNLAKANLAFVGWNTSSDGSGTSYAPGAEIPIANSDLVLHALWSNVAYDANGATGGSVPVDWRVYTAGQSVIVKGNTGALVREHYIWGGWNTAADGSGTKYSAAANFGKVAGVTTLYALWTPTYRVIYDANGASTGLPPEDPTNYLAAASATALGNPWALSKAGFAFAGWNTEVDGAGTQYWEGGALTIGSSDLVLHARWSPRAAKAAVSAYHSFILGEDGNLYAAGHDQFGQLLDSPVSPTYQTKRDTFALVQSGVKAAAIDSDASVRYSGGTDFFAASLFVMNDNTLWAAGYNNGGRLGTGTGSGNSPQNQLTPVQVMNGVASVSIGLSHSMILMNNGELYGSGSNSYGQLGSGDTVTKYSPTLVLEGVAAVSCGQAYTMAVKADGTLWASGENTLGQLGLGDAANRSAFTQVSGMADVAAVSAAGCHTLVLKKDGTVWACGANMYGQLGDGTTTASPSFIQVPGLADIASISASGHYYDYSTITGKKAYWGSSYALTKGGELWAWGYNGSGQLGNGTKLDVSSPAKVLTGVAAVAAGGSHLVVSYNGGYAYYGSAFAIKTDGSVWAAGTNGGQFGDGTTTDRTSFAQIAF